MQAYWPATQLESWGTALQSGHIAAAPAEGVYGYVANPFAEAALQAIFNAKQRTLNKGFIVLIQNLNQLPLFCPALPDSAISAIQTHWQPGQPPTTLVLPALPDLSKLLTGGLSTIALRLPQTDYMQAYLRAAGTPLVSTSLNLSGQPAAVSADQIPAGLLALTLPEPLSGTPSRIFNPLENTWLR
jgi:L-threonylcarbamoyladenylate synthase